MNKAEILHLCICTECERVFNLKDEIDAQEWYYGHDCEAVSD